MRRIALSLTCVAALAACSSDQVVQTLVTDGWTQHQFQVAGEEPYEYICAPIDTRADARAARAHEMVYNGINDIAERAANDLVDGRINSVQFSLRIDREAEALTAQVEAETGCLLTGN